MAPRSGKTPVVLNVYDLSDANEYTASTYTNPITVISSCYSVPVVVGLGLYHTGVEIGGDEYSFASGAGIFTCAPRQAAGAKFREAILMGEFDGSYSEAQRVAYSLRPDFDGASYNLFTKNCNSYSEALCQLLLKKSIPPHINRAAYLGSFLSCLLPSDIGNEAPVGDSSDSGKPISRNTSIRRSDFIYTPFAGTGKTLSSWSSSTTTTNSTALSAEDRRERMRLAALRRMQQPQEEQAAVER